jgi:hypothetical protein
MNKYNYLTYQKKNEKEFPRVKLINNSVNIAYVHKTYKWITT